MLNASHFSTTDLSDLAEFTDVQSDDGDELEEPCNGCGKFLLPDEFLKCPCSNAIYCSTQCQAKDWPQHQTRCSAAEKSTSVEICSNCRRTSSTLCVCRCGKTYYCDRRCQKKHWHRHAHMCACRVQKNQIGYVRATANKAVQVGGDYDGHDCSSSSFVMRSKTSDDATDAKNKSFGSRPVASGPLAGLSALVMHNSSPKKDLTINTSTPIATQTTTTTFNSAQSDTNGLTPVATTARNPLAMLLRSSTAFKQAAGAAAMESSSSAEISASSIGKPTAAAPSGPMGAAAGTALPSFGDDAEADDFTLDLSSGLTEVRNKSRISADLRKPTALSAVTASGDHPSFRHRPSAVNFVTSRSSSGNNADSTKANTNVSPSAAGGVGEHSSTSVFDEASRHSSQQQLLASKSSVGNLHATGSRRASTTLKFSSKNPYVSVSGDEGRSDSPRRASVTMENLLSVNPLHINGGGLGVTPITSFLQRNQLNSVNVSMNRIGIPNCLAVAVYEDLDDPWMNLPMGAQVKREDLHGRKLGRKSVLIVRR